MQIVKNNAQAQQAFDKADDLISDIVGGMVSETREPTVLSEVNTLMDAALSYFRSTDDPYGIAKVRSSLGYKARHIDNDNEAAKALLQDAADRFSQLGKDEDRLIALLELGELDPSHEGARQAVYDAIARGLPEPLEDEIDPRRLANAIASEGSVESALALFQDLIDDAVSKGRRERAAILLRDVARVHEEQRRDKRAATQVLEICLSHAEAIENKAETGAALLRLIDIWWERGNRQKSRAYFDRVAKMCGLPDWQRQQIKVLKTIFA